MRILNFLFIHSVFSFFCLFPLNADAQHGNSSKNNINKVSGYVVCNKKKLNFYDGAATWSKEKHELRIFIFPFRLNSQARQYIAAGKVWMIGMRKKKIKGKLQDFYLPAIQVILYFKPNLSSPKNAYLLKFMFFGIEKTNKMDYFTRNKKELIKVLETLNISEKIVAINTAGNEKIRNSAYQWNLNLSVPVYNLSDSLQ